MRTLGFLLLLSCSLLKPEAKAAVDTKKALANLSRTFEPNQGQAPAGVKYLSGGPLYNIYISAREVTMVSQNPSAALIRMRLVGSSRDSKIEPLDPLNARSSYFIGNDPQKWRSNVPNYGRVALRGVYPGIDFILYGNGQELEYDLVIAARADPSCIRVKFDGASKIRKESSGDVVVKAPGLEIRQHKPAVYQIVGGRRRQVQGDYLVRNNEVRFQVAQYDTSEPLVIDPILIFSTFLGGNVYDYGEGIAVDYLGNSYVTGATASSNFPRAGSFPSNGPALSDVFVTKISPQGTLVYSLILSGRFGYDTGYDIAVDANGSAYVTGSTQGGFPIVNGLQPTPGNNATGPPMQPDPRTGNSAFVTKINPEGSALVYSTYLGGSTNTVGRGIAVDAIGNAIVAGYAGSGFPTFSALQPTFGGGDYDAFVTKINPTGSALVYSTYLGGMGTDQAFALAVDFLGNAYVAGATSGDFPVSFVFQRTYGGGATDAFVVKLNPLGRRVYSTYVGGTGDDTGRGIAVDSTGAAYLTGSTTGDFPLAAPFQANYGGGIFDAFITKINADGTALVYSTYLGGNKSDYGEGIALDSLGNAYVTGGTTSVSSATGGFPVKNAVQPLFGGPAAAFVSELSANGDSLIYSTYLGGDSGDGGSAIAVDAQGNAWVTGGTSSPNFPTVNSFQRLGTAGGFSNAFVSEISPKPAPAPPLFGSFDTPLNNTNNVTGAIAVTGWALSTFIVNSVEIYRDAVGNEPKGKFGLVLVGTAIFVPGARPDVQARYPNYLNNNQAGWGYQLLTNLLPNKGNGTFTLHAMAYDAGGNIVELGAPGKTITCNNAVANKPFGTIDTPAQGGTASGNKFVNFGWALTPGASVMIPRDGSTITVVVDGAPVGHPTYNQYRADIAAAFPDYTNSQGPVGFFYLDTTPLANGLHTISWTVYDDHGRVDGIGSRYFTSANLATNAPADAGAFEASQDVTIRRGFELNREVETIRREKEEPYFIEVGELDRIELHAGASSASDLPVGSCLRDGVFYWQLGPGFLGEHQLVLTRPNGEEIPIRVLVHPKTYFGLTREILPR